MRKNCFFPGGAFHAALAAFLFLAVPVCLSAGETVLHRFVAGDPDPQVENLLYLAAGTELMQAGLSSARNAEAPDYVLNTEYSSADGVLTVIYVLSSSTVPETPLAEMRFDAPIDRTLDARVAEAIRQLLQSAGIAAVPSADARIEGILSLPPPAKAEEPPVIEEEDEMEESEEAAAPSEPAIAGTPSAAVFDTSVSAAGIFLIGGIAEYFHFGAAGMVSAGAAWQREIWRISLDARISLIRAFNNDGVLGGPLYFTTIGPGIRLGTDTIDPFRFSAGFSGGAALITVAGTEATMTKTRPYADAGAYAGFPLGDSLFLGADVSFLMIFDDEVLILGVSTALSLDLGL